MSRPTKQVRLRTAAALKADAQLLAGDRSRVAQAATEDDEPTTETGSVGELWLYGVVGGWWRGFDAESVSNALRQLDVDVLYVRIHSPGGHAADGVAIGNLLRNHRAKVVSVIDGLAASAASVIAIAGDEVVMCPGSQMMLHDASVMTYGNEAQLRRDAEWIGKQSDNYAGVYAYKAGGTPEQWRQVMLANDGEGTWYTADEAVTAKLADSVGTRPAAGSPPVAPEDEFDEGDDEMLARVEHDLGLLEHAVHPAARAAWQGERRSTTPKPPSASAVGSPNTEGGSAVAFSDEQVTTMRQKLGIAEDADEATILAALDEALEERTDPPVATSPTIPEGHVVIPAAKLADLEAGAALATTTAKSLQDKERDTFLDGVRSKYLPTSRAGWEAEYDRDPAGVRAHFDTAPVLIPTTELGLGDQPEVTEADELYAMVFGDEKKGA